MDNVYLHYMTTSICCFAAVIVVFLSDNEGLFVCGCICLLVCLFFPGALGLSKQKLRQNGKFLL